MAITAATKLSDFSGFISEEESAPIFERAARQSVMQQLARQIPVSPNGNKVPVVTGRPTANWVDEGARKPATAGTMTIKHITAEKLAAIVVLSAETVRANPGNYATNIKDQLSEAFAVAFDLATFHNLGGDGTGSGPFSTYIDQTTKGTELGANSQAAGGVYQDFVDSAKEIVEDTDASGRHYRLTGWALDDVLEFRMAGQVDTTGRPIWVDLPADQNASALARPGSLLGRRSFMGEGVANPANTILGYGGDFAGQAAWGVVGGINYRISTEATVTINGAAVSTFENNLVAVLAEAEYGFLMNDADAFIQLRNNSGS